MDEMEEDGADECLLYLRSRICTALPMKWLSNTK